ncbi:hypothetical protein IQ249_25545, partial [Lusitaniella coriacea LEGE 07157]
GGGGGGGSSSGGSGSNSNDNSDENDSGNFLFNLLGISFRSPSQPEEILELEESEPQHVTLELDPFAELFFDKAIFEVSQNDNNTTDDTHDQNGGGDPGTTTDDTHDQGSGQHPDSERYIITGYERNGQLSLTRSAPNDGTLEVQIEVDGPLADYMEIASDNSVSLTNGLYSLSDGEEFLLDWQLKPREEISGLPPLDELTLDQLFGSKVAITAKETFSDGSTTTVKQDAYLYRWLEVVATADPDLSTGKTAAFHEESVGADSSKFVAAKAVKLHIPETVKTTFEGNNLEFNDEDEGIATWFFKKDLSNTTQTIDIEGTVDITADNNVKIGQIDTRSLNSIFLERLRYLLDLPIKINLPTKGFGYQIFSLPFEFTLGSQTYDHFFLNQNGNITFDTGFLVNSPLMWDFLQSQPEIEDTINNGVIPAMIVPF